MDSYITFDQHNPSHKEHIVVTDGYHYRSGTWYETELGGFLLCDKDTPFEISYWMPTNQSK